MHSGTCLMPRTGSHLSSQACRRECRAGEVMTCFCGIHERSPSEALLIYRFMRCSSLSTILGYGIR